MHRWEKEHQRHVRPSGSWDARQNPKAISELQFVARLNLPISKWSTFGLLDHRRCSWNQNDVFVRLSLFFSPHQRCCPKFDHDHQRHEEEIGLSNLNLGYSYTKIIIFFFGCDRSEIGEFFLLALLALRFSRRFFFASSREPQIIFQPFAARKSVERM